MKITIQPKKEEITRILFYAIKCNQEIDFKEGSFIFSSDQLEKSFLEVLMEEFEDLNLKLRKSVPEENPKPKENLKPEESPKKGEKGRGKRNTNNLPILKSLKQIPEISAIIEKDKSDIISIVQLMNMPPKQAEKFAQLMNWAASGCSITEKNMESNLQKEGISFGTYDRKTCSSCCKKYFENNGYYLTFINFLKMYQETVRAKNKLSNEAIIKKVHETRKKQGEGKSKPSIQRDGKLEDLTDIPELKEAIDTLNFTKSKEEVVSHILKAMGYQALDKVYQDYLAVTSCIAVSIKVIDWDKIDYNYKRVLGCYYIDYNVKSTVGSFIYQYFNRQGYKCNYLQFLTLLNQVMGDRYLGQIGKDPLINQNETKESEEETQPIKKVKLPCMPSAPDFERFLGTMNSEESITENLKKS